ncbi:hypothetical protein [Burkholderia cepacia]|uniref:hypothetical protein n=1 Tax=Burkholderia cepacia TaxID=292 RepID=UPI0035278179
MTTTIVRRPFGNGMASAVVSSGHPEDVATNGSLIESALMSSAERSNAWAAYVARQPSAAVPIARQRLCGSLLVMQQQPNAERTTSGAAPSPHNSRNRFQTPCSYVLIGSERSLAGRTVASPTRRAVIGANAERRRYKTESPNTVGAPPMLSRRASSGGPAGAVQSIARGASQNSANRIGAELAQPVTLDEAREDPNELQLSCRLSSPMERRQFARCSFTCATAKFDSTLVHSSLNENRTNGLEMHAITHAHRLVGCITPETRVWRANLTWARADEIKVGDILVGFDEYSKSEQRRKLQASEVVSFQEIELAGCELQLASGQVLTVSYNHMWLVNRGDKSGNLTWMRTHNDRIVGRRIKRITRVVEPATDFDSGWFSGILDGEGWTTRAKHANSFRLGFAQKAGPVLDRALTIAGQEVDRPAFRRHLRAIIYGNRGGQDERQAVHG